MNEKKARNGIEYEDLDQLSKRTELPKSWWYSQSRRRDKDRPPLMKIGKYVRSIPEKTDQWLEKQNRVE